MVGSWLRRVGSAVGALLRGLGFGRPSAETPGHFGANQPPMGDGSAGSRGGLATDGLAEAEQADAAVAVEGAGEPEIEREPAPAVAVEIAASDHVGPGVVEEIMTPRSAVDRNPGETDRSAVERGGCEPVVEVESAMSDAVEPKAVSDPVKPASGIDEELHGTQPSAGHDADAAATGSAPEPPRSAPLRHDAPGDIPVRPESVDGVESLAPAPSVEASSTPSRVSGRQRATPFAPEQPADPPVSDEIKSIVEALIFASPEPLTPKALFKVLDSEPKEDVQRAIESLRRDYAGRGGLQLIELAGGFQIVTRQELSEWVRRLFHERKSGRLSVQALETLAVIAYKQPVTAAEIAEIRGVNTSGVLATLVERKLIKISGRKPVVGRPFLYATTREFLIRFGLNDLSDLPKVEEMAEALGFDLPSALDTGPTDQLLPLGDPEVPPEERATAADSSAEPEPGQREGSPEHGGVSEKPGDGPETVN
jgi:segregation and condensation protein B